MEVSVAPWGHWFDLRQSIQTDWSYIRGRFLTEEPCEDWSSCKLTDLMSLTSFNLVENFNISLFNVFKWKLWWSDFPWGFSDKVFGLIVLARLLRWTDVRGSWGSMWSSPLLLISGSGGTGYRTTYPCTTRKESLNLPWANNGLLFSSSCAASCVHFNFHPVLMIKQDCSATGCR